MLAKKDNEIIVFTDGSYMNKNGRIYSGYGILFPNAELPNASRPYISKNLNDIGTNQRTELYAIFIALKLIDKFIKPLKIKIYTDSEYSINSLTVWYKTWEKNNWMTSKKTNVIHSDLIKKIIEIKNKYIVQFIHVKAHTGNKDILSLMNNEVDKLAKLGAMKIPK